MDNCYTVINSGKKVKLDSDINVYKSEKAGEGAEIIEKLARENPDALIRVYGGDGSVFEAANALMSAGANKSATLNIVPHGTGNDFARNFPKNSAPETKIIDLITFNGKYSANEINIGFDCDVVIMTEKVKRLPFLRGSAAYAVSVLTTLFKKLGKEFDIEITNADGSHEAIHGNYLLCLMANGAYYGGGFKAAPLASLDDGYLEFIYCDKVSRLEFLNFVGGYKKGIHILPDGTVNPKYSSFLHYRRITSARFLNVGKICADGEIFEYDNLTVSVEKQCLKIMM